MTDDDDTTLNASTPLSPEILEKLAHPLRQKILLYIEQEGEVGYKELKNVTQVATGTLYHHLKILKDLIVQNEQKKYILTPKGQEMLDHLFIDKKQSTKFDQKEPPLNEVHPAVKEQSLPVSSARSIRTQDIFYTVFHLPDQFYQMWIAIFLILGTVIIIIKPAVVFFDFIPIRIAIEWTGLAPLAWAFIAGILLNISVLSTKHRLSLASWGIFFFYNDVNIFLSLVISLFVGFQASLWLQLFSIFLQGLYIVIWTIILSEECWSWERSLLTAVIQNYLVLFFIP